MSEWLDLMLAEIRRKQHEAEEAVAEAARRAQERAAAQPGTGARSEDGPMSGRE